MHTWQHATSDPPYLCFFSWIAPAATLSPLPASRQLVSGIPAIPGGWDFSLLPADYVCLVFLMTHSDDSMKKTNPLSPLSFPITSVFSFVRTLKDSGLWRENQMSLTQNRGSGVSCVPRQTVSPVQVYLVRSQAPAVLQALQWRLGKYLRGCSRPCWVPTSSASS